MALTLKTTKLEPVTIDGEVFALSLTMERRLRLAKAMSGGGFSEESLDIMAECFGDKKDIARAKLAELAFDGLCELQVYLMNGDDGVERFREATKKDNKEQANAE